MIAAIYARKSTEQKDVTEDAKSVERQRDHAREYATKKGWHVSSDHIYVDDGVSGAEFERRPGFMRLMNALKPCPEFQVLIMSEESRLGREQIGTAYALKQLAQAGVRVFYYMDDCERKLDSPLDKMIMAATSFAAEMEREKGRQRVYDAMVRRAKAGQVTGGRVFGYRNEEVTVGNGDAKKRSHVKRVIEPAERDVVIRIFEMYAAGIGLRGLAKTLNAEHALAPKPFRTGRISRGWAASTIRTILTRESYRGLVIWNRSLKRNRWGEADQRKRPESEWIRTRVPELQIVSDELWGRVATIRKGTEAKAIRFANGRLSGRPPKHGVQNPLAGLTLCGACGGAMVVEVSSRKSGSVPQFRCRNHRFNGTCDNAQRIDAALLIEHVLTAFEEHALTPEAVSQVARLLERDDLRERRKALLDERDALDKKIARLVAVIEEAGDAKALVAKVREHETRKTAIDAELEALQPIPQLPPAVVRDRLAEWRRLLRSSPTQARAVIQRVVDGRITLWPVRAGETQQEDGYAAWVAGADGYRFQAQTRFDKLFSGLVSTVNVLDARPAWLDDYVGETGLEHYGPEDTLDWHYNELLVSALGESPDGDNCLVPVRGFEPRSRG